ncbi:MAG: hypothetical protein GY895_09540 [Phycisphaera sp.]|nr:hypothetical protein [Phycisphaera sp.]
MTLAMIIVLVGILVVALSQASGTAQKAQTSFLMNSMSAGLAQFKGDHGYFPPVLGAGVTQDQYPGWSRDVIRPQTVSDPQNWYSVTSAAEYLLGYGNRSADGYGIVTNDANPFPDIAPGNLESPTLGFRSPGIDGAWGAVLNPRPSFDGFPGAFVARNPGGFNAGGTSWPPNPNDDNELRIKGRIFGPYLEIKDANSLGGLRPDGSIARPEDPDYVNRPKVILDYWGTPIRYYRRPYLGDDPSVFDGSFDLGDVFALRPWQIDKGLESNGIADAEGDRSTTPQLKAADFVLLSEGPNRSVDETARFDINEFNRDNLQELGP